MEPEPIDLGPLLAHLDAEIAETLERLLQLRAMRASLVRVTQPPTDAPQAFPAHEPPPMMPEGGQA